MQSNATPDAATGEGLRLSVGVTPRSVFLQWPLLSREGERVLTDLAAHTRINTIELSNFDLWWGETRDENSPTSPAPLALPADSDFDGLSVPTTDSTRFHALTDQIELVHERGFQVACNLAPLYVSPAELARLSCVDVTGERVPAIHPQLAVYACPNNPDAVAYGRAMARAFVDGWPHLDALTVNHVEYPFWPQATVGEVFVCFCDWCEKNAGRSGIDFAWLRREIRAVYSELTGLQSGERADSPRALLAAMADRPAVGEWLRFRADSMTAFVRDVMDAARQAAAARGAELRAGLEFQLPTLAPFVGTDFEALSPLFDWLSPKFPDYLGAAVIPLVAAEVASGPLEPEVRRTLREALRLGPGPDVYDPIPEPAEGILYANTYDVSVVRRQSPLLDSLRGRKPLHPYVWLYGNDLRGLEEKVAAARGEGFEGFFLWCWDRDLTSESIEALAGVL
jgi:hypothetical protein